MDADTLEELLQSVENPVETFRNNDLANDAYVFPAEYTNWIEEQRAVREACAIVDQSYHMQTVRIDGPKATDLLAGIATNSFETIRTGDPPQAINMLMCSPDGYVISDVILFYLGENTFTSVGAARANDWIRYNAERSEHDVTATLLYTPFDDDPPTEFRFQVQGPDSLHVIDEVTDGPLPDIPFFGMDEICIQGRKIYALAHGMADVPGLEIFGPYEYHDEIWDEILEAGEAYGIRRMGVKAYKTGKIGSGWFNMPVPAIYSGTELKSYREWLSADNLEAQLSIGGSYVSEDISDYYMTPMELGRGHLVSFDHEFVGRAALEGMIDEPERKRVTFVWDDDDVVDIYASLFRDGQTAKFIELPDTASRWSKTHYDEVRKEGETVGISKYPGYLYYEREMLSLGTIDLEYSEPGTEVTFVWGEDTEKSNVERHCPVEVTATVAPSPYVRGGRRDM